MCSANFAMHPNFGHRFGLEVSRNGQTVQTIILSMYFCTWSSKYVFDYTVPLGETKCSVFRVFARF